MIVVRPFQPADKPAIEAMHAAMGFDYVRPDWNKMLVSAVIEVDGKPTMAAFLRKTAETFLLLDSEAGRKRDHLGRLLMLHKELIEPMKRAGLSDAHSWLPPEIEADFGKLLLHLGWQKQLWPSFGFQVK